MRIDATVQGTAVTDFALLTVARRQVFLSFGTGNEIDEPNQAQYSMHRSFRSPTRTATPWSARRCQLRDPVDALPGGHAWFATGPPAYWATPHVPAVAAPTRTCNHNGVLDAGEDLNGNNKIEAGNILTVVRTGTASTATTDKNGSRCSTSSTRRTYAHWLDVASDREADRARHGVRGND